MIIQLRFSNFYSFAEGTELSFELGKKPTPSAYDIEIGGTRRLNKALAVIGANGSGKTQFIKPLAFLSWFISSSFLGSKPEDPVPFHPHTFKREEDSLFEITFLLDNEEYRYKLIANRKHVVHEALYKKTSHLFSYVFVREKTESGYDYKQQGFGFPSSQARNIRSNASLLSAAHNYDVPMASTFVEYFNKYSFNLNVSGRQHFHGGNVLESAEYFFKHAHFLSDMERMMCDFDLGICSVKIHEAEGKDDQGRSTKVFVPVAVHECENMSFELPFFEESSGTQSAFVLLRRILPVLENGGVAIIDEIDNDLHPHMLPHILELFKFEHTNPRQAQIIFTCHTPEVLNLLKKHQAYLVEKIDQQSEAWRLDEVTGLRADDNLYAKYMAGALSAVPNL
ncbi:AAA family ATPase [Alkalimarinus coralli]|uniref:AAA family ATPase n=1 Tax=Alkalimarinus coralli TaxID=2935863 RepID=UPI00202B8888|nr:ATP-binding protein [Alkalimarinus coralli]